MMWQGYDCIVMNTARVSWRRQVPLKRVFARRSGQPPNDYQSIPNPTVSRNTTNLQYIHKVQSDNNKHFKYYDRLVLVLYCITTDHHGN